MHIAEPCSIFLHETVDGEARCVRNHVDCFHILLVLGVEHGELFHLRLLVDDALGEFVVFSIDPARFLLLQWEVKRAAAHWATDRCRTLELTRGPRPINSILLLLLGKTR